MPDPHRIRRELKELLARPEFTSLLERRRQFAGPKARAATPEAIAAQTADALVQRSPLVNPVTVELVRGPAEFYRAHDGGARQDSARTIGGWWAPADVIETIWDATARLEGAARDQRFWDFLRASSFVLPEWNDMTRLACLSIPPGGALPVVRGRGSWKAMVTSAAQARPSGGAIRSAADVMREGMMPLPGTEQCLFPLLNDMWIAPVPRATPSWPLRR